MVAGDEKMRPRAGGELRGSLDNSLWTYGQKQPAIVESVVILKQPQSVIKNCAQAETT